MQSAISFSDIAGSITLLLDDRRPECFNSDLAGRLNLIRNNSQLLFAGTVGGSIIGQGFGSSDSGLRDSAKFACTLLVTGEDFQEEALFWRDV